MKRSQRRQMQEAIKEIPFAVFCLDTEKKDDAAKLAETMKAPFFHISGVHGKDCPLCGI